MNNDSIRMQTNREGRHSGRMTANFYSGASGTPSKFQGSSDLILKPSDQNNWQPRRPGYGSALDLRSSPAPVRLTPQDLGSAVARQPKGPRPSSMDPPATPGRRLGKLRGASPIASGSRNAAKRVLSSKLPTIRLEPGLTRTFEAAGHSEPGILRQHSSRGRQRTPTSSPQ